LSATTSKARIAPYDTTYPAFVFAAMYQFITLDGRVLHSRRWDRGLDEFKQFARENIERFAARIATGETSPAPIPEAVTLLDGNRGETDRMELGERSPQEFLLWELRLTPTLHADRRGEDYDS
jgi:hypothetical protein